MNAQHGKHMGRKVFTYVFLTIAVVVSLFPFYFMFVSATNTNAQILSASPKLTFGTNLLVNLKNLNGKLKLGRVFLNSMIMTVSYTGLAILLHSMAGYALSKFDFKGRGIFLKVVMPNMKPAVGAIGIYMFMSMWNSFMWPLIILGTKKMYNFPVALAMLDGVVWRKDYGVVMLATAFATIPILLVFLLFQKQFVAGIMGGAVKE